MGADDTPAMELTRNPVDGSWGFICREHGIHRYGLTERHALNVEAKHLREDHPDPLLVELDLKEAARMFLAAQNDNTRDLWEALTGMGQKQAHAFACAVVSTEGPVRLAVVPF